MEPLEFSKTSKKRRLKRQIFCFCGMTVVSSTVFEREISCQHVDVKMRMLRFFSAEKSGVISRWGQSFSDWDFHTCLSFMYDTLVLYSLNRHPSGLENWLFFERSHVCTWQCHTLTCSATHPVFSPVSRFYFSAVHNEPKSVPVVAQQTKMVAIDSFNFGSTD